MRKTAFLLLAYAYICAYACSYAFSFQAWEDSVYTLIKDSTIKGLQANFHVPGLSIGKISGPLVGQISFSDVVLPDFARAQKVTVNYNLFKFLYIRDIVPAISSIKIEGATIDIKRASDNNLNTTSLLIPLVPGGPPPPVFTSKLYFKNCRINYIDALKPLSQSFDKVAGQISFAKKDKIIINLTGQAGGPVKIAGAFDFKKGGCDFNISVENIRFYEQLFSGKTQLSFLNNQLDFDFKDLKLYGGQADGKATINFAQKAPRLQLNAQVQEINLAGLAQNSPGITGSADGSVALSGLFHDLRGKISARLRQGALLGQSIDLLSSDFTISNGGILFNNFSATSKTAAVNASGSISSSLVFDFKADARGIRLAGRGFPGPMEALVEDFTGNVNWQLNDAFFASPLKHIRASGRAHLSQGRIGEQLFDRAAGGFSMGNGILNLEKVTFENKLSSLEASGQIGIGVPTGLVLTASKIKLEDFKALNYLLPKEAQNPTGTADIQLNVTGELSREAKIESIDSLLGLNASGEVFLFNGRLANIPINKGHAAFSWENRRLSISTLSLVTPRSNINLKLSLGNQLDGDLKGIINLDEFSALTEQYGNLDGEIGIDLLIKGQPGQPDLLADFWINNLQFNRINFSRIEGKLNYMEGQLLLPKPLLLQSGTDRYFLSGQAKISDKLEDSVVDLNLSTSQSNFPAFALLASRLQSELSRRAVTNAGEKTTIDVSNLTPSLPRDFRFIYSLGNEKDSFIKLKEQTANQNASMDPDALPFEARGKVSLSLSLKGKINNPSGLFSGEIKNGAFQKFLFDSLKTEGQIKNHRVSIKNLDVAQKSGRLAARGEIGFDGSATLEATGGRIEIGGIQYDKVSAEVESTPRGLAIKYFSLSDSSLSGFIGASISLEAHLADKAPGLLNLFGDDIRWLEGRTRGTLEITGTPDRLKINGTLAVRDTSVFVRAIDAKISQISGEAVFHDSRLSFQALHGVWQGESSRQAQNNIDLAGNIDLSQISKGTLALDLNLKPVDFTVNLKDLYSGGLRIHSARLNGPLAFDMSQGPTLTAQAEIQNAVITIPSKQEEQKKMLPLKLNLDVKLERNVYAVMGDLSGIDISNPLLNLEVTSDNLDINGALDTPLLFGKVKIKRGSVSLLGREFLLLSTEEQKLFYPYDPDKIKENLASFDGSESAMPDVQITGKVEVENSEKDAAGQITKRKVLILSRLKGLMGARQEGRGLKITFSGFTRDKTAGDLRPATYSEQDLKVMLLPDFIKSFTGVEKDASGQPVNTNAVIADVLSSRAQSFIFRGLERNLEQQLGLESLTLEYNFGKDLKQAMGVRDTSSFEERKPDWKIGFVKGFFDRLFIDVKYAQVMEKADMARTTLNYQITYKLSPICSIMYYQEPISAQQNYAGNQKVTLSSGFSFW